MTTKRRDPSPALYVRLARLDEITRYTNNPRQNSQAVAKVRASIEAFGWRQPIVLDKDGVIIIGDTRYLAAEAMGLVEVPVHDALDLTPAQVRALRIADNRTHEESEWDEDRVTDELRAMLAEGTDLAATAFDDDELQKFLAEDPDLTPVDTSPLPTMTWVLIGIPTADYIEIAEHVDAIALAPNVFVEMTANADENPMTNASYRYDRETAEALDRIEAEQKTKRRPGPSAEDIPEADFSKGVRGKYAKAYREAAEDPAFLKDNEVRGDED